MRLWRRGEDFSAAAVIFSADPASMVAYGYPDRDARPERLVFVERTGFFDGVTHLGDRSGPKTRLDLPTDADAHWHRGFLAVRPRTPWTVGGVTHPPDSVLGLGFEAFLSGARDFRVLFEPGPRRALQGFFWSGGRLVVSVLDDLVARFPVFTPPNPAGPRARSRACPNSGWSTFGPSTPTRRSRTATCSPAANDPVTPSTLMLTGPTCRPRPC